MLRALGGISAEKCRSCINLYSCGPLSYGYITSPAKMGHVISFRLFCKDVQATLSAARSCNTATSLPDLLTEPSFNKNHIFNFDIHFHHFSNILLLLLSIRNPACKAAALRFHSSASSAQALPRMAVAPHSCASTINQTASSFDISTVCHSRRRLSLRGSSREPEKKYNDRIFTLHKSNCSRSPPRPPALPGHVLTKPNRILGAPPTAIMSLAKRNNGEDARVAAKTPHAPA